MAEDIQESEQETKMEFSKAESSTTLQELLSMGDNVREVIVNDETGDKYVVMQKIGSDYSAIVYKGGYHPMHIDDYNGIRAHDIALKVINLDDQEEFVHLSREFQRSSDIDCSSNIVGVIDSFIDKGRFFVSMPYSDMGSLRSIMLRQFPRGLPEDCIAMALRETVKGLCFLHERLCLHKDINAGHVFLYGKPEIKLAYAASVYEHNGDDHGASSSSALPARTICDWGSAPEVYNSQTGYTDKADVWLIGITALELGYGGLSMANRTELEEMIKKIIRKRRLPKTDKKRVERAKEKGKELLDLGKRLLSGEWKKKEKKKKRTFSEAFEEMVVKCVAWNAYERPTTFELLQNKFFMDAGDLIIFKNMIEAGDQKRA